MVRSAVFVALGVLLAGCTDAAEPVSPLPAAVAEFEVFLDVDAQGAVALDGAAIGHDLESAEVRAKLRTAAMRRVGRYDPVDPLSCILPLARVRLRVDLQAQFGRVNHLLVVANGSGLSLWDFSLAAPSDGDRDLPFPLRSCPRMHSVWQPWSPERRLVVQLHGSTAGNDVQLDAARGWSFETPTQGRPRDLRAELEWPQVQRLVAEARTSERTSILSRTIPSDTPWRDVLPLLRQLDELGVDHYEFWLTR